MFSIFAFSFKISCLILKGCINILFSKLLWQISWTFFCFYFVFLSHFLSIFFVCILLLRFVFYLLKFNEKHFLFYSNFQPRYSSVVFECFKRSYHLVVTELRNRNIRFKKAISTTIKTFSQKSLGCPSFLKRWLFVLTLSLLNTFILLLFCCITDYGY